MLLFPSTTAKKGEIKEMTAQERAQSDEVPAHLAAQTDRREDEDRPHLTEPANQAVPALSPCQSRESTFRHQFEMRHAALVLKSPLSVRGTPQVLSADRSVARKDVASTAMGTAVAGMEQAKVIQLARAECRHYRAVLCASSS
jgi:hypothetical protein